ncbi:MAG: hypothetical protein IJO74_01335 [Clostridia bacterium]|nr:hypothetical protein [Clostridia bacterium]
MSFYLISAVALIFAVSGMLIYRLGVSDGITMRKNANAESLFKRAKEKKGDEDWQSIIGYNHKN